MHVGKASVDRVEVIEKLDDRAEKTLVRD